MLLKDLLAAVEEIGKDLAYTQNLQAKWEKEAEKFPVLFEYIKKQSGFFKEEIERLLSLNISNSAVSDFVKNRRGATVQISKSEGGQQASPVASSPQSAAAEERTSGGKQSEKKSGDKRSASRNKPRKRGRKGPGEP